MANSKQAGNPPKGYNRLEGSERHPSPETKYIELADPNEIVSITIVLRRRADTPAIPGHEFYLAAAPNQRSRLPQNEFAKKYGAHEDDIQAVIQFLEDHKLTSILANAARRTVEASGTVAQMNETFGVNLCRYEHEIQSSMHKGWVTENYRGRDGFIHVPAPLSDIITGVFGLDNRTITKRNAADPAVTNPIPIATLRTFYNFPANSAAGQTIGIASFGGYFQSDMQSFFGASLPALIPISVDAGNACVEAVTSAVTPIVTNILTFPSSAGINVGAIVNGPGILPTPPATTVTVAGVTATTVTLDTFVSSTISSGTRIYFNADAETNQDVQIVASAAPGAAVAIYFSVNSQKGWVDLINRVIHPNAGDPLCSVLSCSFYISNGDDSATLSAGGVSSDLVNALSDAFQDAASQGVTMCIASGDTGSNSKAGKFPKNTTPVTFGGDGKAHVQYPGSDPWVLSVGGTTLGKDTAASPSFVEYVWNDPSPSDNTQWGTTGGGVSDFFDLPSYQNNAGIPRSVNDATRIGRGVPDVAANASANSGYSGIIWKGGGFNGNGTSASAPLWAALIAVMNAALGENIGFANPALYSFGGVGLHDIDPTAGPTNNGNSGIAGYSAAAGWDACSGLGTPDGITLLGQFQQFYMRRCFFYIIEKSNYGKDMVDTLMGMPGGATFNPAFCIAVDGFRAVELGINSPADLSATSPTLIVPQISNIPPGITVNFVGPVQPTDASLPNIPQRFLYYFQLHFNDDTAFSATSQTYTLNCTITSMTVRATDIAATVSGSGNLIFYEEPDPYFSNGTPPWLSIDLRVFTMKPNDSKFGVKMGPAASDTNLFISTVIFGLTTGSGSAGGDKFEDLPTEEEKSALFVMPQDSDGHDVYNFAVARVRMLGKLLPATAARLFFRMFQAQSTATAYVPPGTYPGQGPFRTFSDGVSHGHKIPLAGIQAGEYVSIPFFASPRVGNIVAGDDMTTQTDSPNVQNIPVTGVEVDTFYGCWLDINQTGDKRLPVTPPATNVDGPFTGLPMSSIAEVITRNPHQCLVAEISFDDIPSLPEGASCWTSDKIAQRNFSWVDIPNPGADDSRVVPQTFEIKPTEGVSMPGAVPDELMIDWGTTPSGSIATIYFPAVKADKILELATTLYSLHRFKKIDENTFQCPVDGITYVPIPSGTPGGANFAGLLSLAVPGVVVKGQVYKVLIRQMTNVFVAAPPVINTQGPDQGQGMSWMKVIGNFRLTIPVTTKTQILPLEERLYSFFLWIQNAIPMSSRWYPIFLRYLPLIGNRVRGLGGDPAGIKPSPTGDGKNAPGGGYPIDKGGIPFTGKVAGLIYDRFGDFDGFILDTERGKHTFKNREIEVEEVAYLAWSERIVTTVFAELHNHKHIKSIVLHSPPPPFRRK